MISDANKNITAITYNHLNLPTQITFATTGNIVYIYNAAGQKVQKTVNRTGTAAVVTDYLGGYQYDNTVLKFFSTVEGYVEPSGSSYQYIYQYKDHLGNVRLSYDKTLAIKQESNYYPFGLKQEGYNNVKIGVENKYKYNGQELQDELGLNFYDYGARNYDPALGRWMNIDPLAEKSRRFSPYTYALNNPVFFIDPDGMMASPPPDWVARADKSVYWDNNATSQSTAKSGETYLGKEVVYTSKVGTTVNLHSDKSWDEQLVLAQVDKNDTARINEQGDAITVPETTETEMTLDTERINQVSSAMGLANDIKSTLYTAAGVADDVGHYSTALKVIGGATGAISMLDSGFKIYDSISKGETPKLSDALSFTSGTVSVATTFLKVSNPVGIAIGVAQISWGLYSMTN